MKIQVYTAITNNHDPMREDIKVFTDWERFGSPLAAARFYKSCPHLLFPEADWTIWVDGNVFLNVSPKELVDRARIDFTIGDYFGVFEHFHNKTILQEAVAITTGGFDTLPNVNRALFWHDKLKEISKIQLPVAMTMLLVRKNCYHTNIANANWWQAMCYSSFRDQLTFPLFFPGPYWPTVDFTQPNEYFARVA